VLAHSPRAVTIRAAQTYAGEKVVAHPEPNGPPTVARYFRSQKLRAMTEHCLSALGVSGFFVVVSHRRPHRRRVRARDHAPHVTGDASQRGSQR